MTNLVRYVINLVNSIFFRNLGINLSLFEFLNSNRFKKIAFLIPPLNQFENLLCFVFFKIYENF